MRRLIIIILFYFVCNTLLAQNSTIDSILEIASKMPDTANIDYLNKQCWAYRNSQPFVSVKIGSKAIALALELNYQEGLLKAYSFSGVAYRNLGNYAEAFDFYFKGLELAYQLKNDEQRGYAHTNLGNLFIYQDDYASAIEHLSDAMEIAIKIKNEKMLAYSYLNLGRAYLMKFDFNISLIYLHKALELRRKMNDKEGEAVSIKYIGDVYNAQNEYNIAMINYKNALKLTDFENDKDLLSDILNKIAIVFIKEGNLSLAKQNAEKSLFVANQVNSKRRSRDALKTLAEIYIQTRLFEKATQCQSLVIDYNDTLFNLRVQEKIANIQYFAEQQRKQAKIDLLNKEQEIRKLQLWRQQMLIWGLFGLMGLGGIFVALLIKSNIQRKRTNAILEIQKHEIAVKNAEISQRSEEITAQRDEIEAQKDLVTLQNEELKLAQKQITGSIQYAKRIQKAVFPSFDYIKQHFEDGFVLFKPKDIVSGDFFWAKLLDNKLFVAAADCTGHGVPGAFMSLLGITALNEIINLKKIFEPYLILEELRKEIKTSLKQQSIFDVNEPKDGMDISFIVYDLDDKTIQFSGANLPVYILRNQELNELKGDRIPIGVHLIERNFTQKEFKLQSNDYLYMFSDGYHSQIGGPNNQRFKTKTFKSLLSEICVKDAFEQKNLLEQNFLDWKKSFKQIDDIMVIGLKVK